MSRILLQYPKNPKVEPLARPFGLFNTYSVAKKMKILNRKPLKKQKMRNFQKMYPVRRIVPKTFTDPFGFLNIHCCKTSEN